MVEIDRRKAALIAELEISRGDIRRSVRACEESLNLVSVVRRSVRQNLKFWLPGAALGGWVVSKLLSLQLSRPRRMREPRDGGAPGGGQGRTGGAGWVVALLKIAVDLARPTLLEMGAEWLSRKASHFSTATGGGAARAGAPAEAERQGHARNGMF